MSRESRTNRQGENHSGVLLHTTKQDMEMPVQLIIFWLRFPFNEKNPGITATTLTSSVKNQGRDAIQ